MSRPLIGRSALEPLVAAFALLVAFIYLLGIHRMVLGALILVVLFEQWKRWSETRTIHHPTTLFAIGWVFPFGLTLLPLGRVAFQITVPGPYTDLVWCGVVFIFYLIGALMSRWQPAQSAAVVSREVRHLAPVSVVMALLILSNIGFFLALVSNSFALPLFQPDVTAAAKTFFRWQGTASLFNLGKIAILISVTWYLVPHRDGGRYRALLLLLAVVFVGEQLLYGKRMGLLLSLLSVAILFSVHRRINARYVALVVGLVATVVLANAYIRAGPIFEAVWKKREMSAFQDVWQYALAQPAIYVTETFDHIGQLAENGPSSAPGHGMYSFRRINESERMHPGDQYTWLRSRGKMTGFIGSSLADGGLLLGTVWTVAVSMVLWVLYRLRYKPLGLILYAFLGAKYAFLWTGNMWSTPSTYYNIAVMTVLFVLVELVRLRRTGTHRTCARQTRRSSGELYSDR